MPLIASYFMTSFPVPRMHAMTTLTSKHLRASAYQQTYALLIFVEKLLRRHNFRVAAGRPTPWTNEQAASVIAYAAALRELTAQTAFPDRISWPAVPAVLSTLIIS